MGAGQLQVCTEIMLRGFKIVTGLNQGLQKYLDEMGMASVDDAVGQLYKNVTSFDYLLKQSKSEKVRTTSRPAPAAISAWFPVKTRATTPSS